MLSARDVSQFLFSRSLNLDGEREISRHFANWEMGGVTQKNTGAMGKPREHSCPTVGGGVPPEEEVSKGQQWPSGRKRVSQAKAPAVSG